MKEVNAVRKNDDKNKFIKNILIYSVLFFVISFYIMLIFIKNNKTFIWNNDALEQHVVTMRYFKEIIGNFFKTGSITSFSWKIMGGLDLFSNLSYYILGDIFSYIFLFFKSSQIEAVYNLLVIVRLYFVGISFLVYCSYKKMNKSSTIVGTLIYTFSSFAIYWGVTHPYFLDALILFSLVMLGIERIILEDKTVFYTFIIAITFIVNFYFAYAIALIIAIYGTILIIYTYKSDGFKKIFKVLLKTLFYSCIGVFISAVVLVPTIASFLNSERSLSNNIYPYSLNYYRNFVNMLITTGKEKGIYIGVQSIIFVALPTFIRRRKDNYPIYILMLILILPLLISQIGSIFCGFSYPSNRWTFVLTFIFAYISSLMINNTKALDKKDLLFIILFSLFFWGLNFILDVAFTTYLKITLILSIFFLMLMFNKNKLMNLFKKIDIYVVLLISLLMFGILCSCNYLFDNKDSNYISEFVTAGTLNDIESTINKNINDFSKAVEYIKEKDNGFYKISKSYSGMHNISLINDYNSINGYYSITPNLLSKLALDLANSEYGVSRVTNEFDYRTKITNLLGVKYYINSSNVVPYGYTKIDDYKSGVEEDGYIISVGNSNIYKNDYALSFGNLYTSYITQDEYESLSALEKEDSLLKNVTLDEKMIKSTNIIHGNNNYDSIGTVDYEIIDQNNLLDNNTITVKEGNVNDIQLYVDEIKNSEVYIAFENLRYEPFTKEELINQNPNKNYKWYTPNYSYQLSINFNGTLKTKNIENYKTSPYYVEMPNKLFNFGYNEEIKNGVVSIKFSSIGKYSFDSLKIYKVSMDDYENDIKNLNRSNFEVVDFNDGYLEGIVDAETNGILQFSTIYDKGWKVYVDNKQVNTFIANKYFLGIEIEEGYHKVYLKYNNPYIIPGLILSGVGTTLLIITVIYKKKHKDN